MTDNKSKDTGVGLHPSIHTVVLPADPIWTDWLDDWTDAMVREVVHDKAKKAIEGCTWDPETIDDFYAQAWGSSGNKPIPPFKEEEEEEVKG